MATQHKLSCGVRRFRNRRGAVRLLLGSYLRRDPAFIKLAVGEHGKPYLIDHDSSTRHALRRSSGQQVSLSHGFAPPRVLARRSETRHLMRARHWLGLRATITVEAGPDARERDSGRLSSNANKLRLSSRLGGSAGAYLEGPDMLDIDHS
jgi:hypothetical protein